MSRPSFLLALSASEPSKNAAEVCWQMAKAAGADVRAMHVVDTHGAWEVLGFDKPGFLGSGVAVAAYEAAVSALGAQASKLSEVYEAHARGHGFDSQTVVEDGDPADRLCQRAEQHDLVVIGHRPRPYVPEEHDKRLYRGYSVAERLAHESPRPLLVVQQEIAGWSTLRVMLSVRHINEHYVNACMRLAGLLSLDVEIVGLATGLHEEVADSFVADLRAANPATADARISVTRISDTVVDDYSVTWWTRGTDIEGDSLPDVLISMPTRDVGPRRVTVFGSSPAYFVRHLTLPAILLFPEAAADTFLAGRGESERVAAKA